MAYSDLAIEEQILLSAEFVGRGLEVPQELKQALGPELLRDIENPETFHDRPEIGNSPGHRSEGA